MQKSIIDHNTLNIIVRNMPESIRNLYESGNAVRMTIIRRKNLYKYGRTLYVRLWKDVMIESDMTEFYPADRIAKDVIGYFVNGEKGPVCIGYNGTDSVYTGDFGIRFAI